jgi:coproporphyrinogen III oxidase
MTNNDLEIKKSQFHQHVLKLQDEITKAILAIDPGIELINDPWDRQDHKGMPGGGGITRAFKGEVIENAGVNTSKVFGAIDPEFAKKLGGSGEEMWACGISLIIHPKNPRVPTVHANFRMIEAGNKFWRTSRLIILIKKTLIIFTKLGPLPAPLIIAMSR